MDMYMYIYKVRLKSLEQVVHENRWGLLCNIYVKNPLLSSYWVLKFSSVILHFENKRISFSHVKN